MAIGILFLISVVFLIPGAATFAAMYVDYLAHHRTPPGDSVRVTVRAPVPRPAFVLVEARA